MSAAHQPTTPLVPRAVTVLLTCGLTVSACCFSNRIWEDSTRARTSLGGLPPSPRTPNSLWAESALFIDSAPWLVT